ncbi:MAG: hypothetical protein FWD58_10545 [Firmicutes bacterium]|nr:hypothetical protein [Bacillota bacterium]
MEKKTAKKSKAKKAMIALVIVALAVVLAFVFAYAFGACGWKYNAKLYDYEQIWVSEEFLENNTTPQIINDQRRYGEVFKDFSIKIDFEKEMLLVNIVTTIYFDRDYNISRIQKKGTSLKISYRMESKMACDASMPGKRCLVVKMKKLEIISVEFIEQKMWF